MKLSFTGLNVALVLLLVPGIARAANPDLNELIGTVVADTYTSTNSSSGTVNGNPSAYGIGGSLAFAVDYGNRGLLKGHGRCSTQNGGGTSWEDGEWVDYEENFIDVVADETGQSGAGYCYCQLDTYTPSGGSAQSLSGPWVLGDITGDDYCSEYCASDCAEQLAYDALNGYSYLSFRIPVFNAYAPSSSASGDAITTRTYVDNLLSGKQAKITTTGTNKLMTFGSSAGNVGERDIVSTLGTSTTATTVPEVGPIVTGLNGKQNTVNGTANFVMTGTGTAGTVGEKPVYSSTNNYTSALVTAQTINTAATDAANSEMSCSTYVSGQSQTPENCLLWTINQSTPSGLSTRVYLDSTKKGVGYCYRGLNGVENSDIGDGSVTVPCSASTLAYLGASGSRNNKWGAVFSWGEVTGISVCSSINPVTFGAVATDSQGTSLDAQYIAKNAGRFNWCKLQGPVESKWVFLQPYNASGNSTCAQYGALDCGAYVLRNERYRTAIFNTVQ